MSGYLIRCYTKISINICKLAKYETVVALQSKYDLTFLDSSTYVRLSLAMGRSRIAIVANPNDKLEFPP
jgi:hypothetical protein